MTVCWGGGVTPISCVWFRVIVHVLCLVIFILLIGGRDRWCHQPTPFISFLFFRAPNFIQKFIMKWLTGFTYIPPRFFLLAASAAPVTNMFLYYCSQRNIKVRLTRLYEDIYVYYTNIINIHYSRICHLRCSPLRILLL